MGNREPHISKAGQVKILQANLDERYREMFCITQELLQNADDAKAKNILIGKCEGFSELHSLTNIPGLFFLNDGPVSENDLDQIFSIADSNKNAAQEKIGKFGLGMKSVFHICETFMIFGEQNGRQDAEFFDPWCGEWEDHKNWKHTFDIARIDLLAALKKKIGPAIQDWPQWFGIWLPLRQKKHCEYAGHLFDCYPSNQDLLEQFDSANCMKIAQMFPFMKHVQNICFWGALSHIDKLQIDAARRFSLTNGRLDGVIRVGGQEIRLTGCEKLSCDSELRDFPNRPDWPRISDNSSGRAQMIPEKAIPHIAIGVQKIAQERSGLTIRYAAYLPLTDESMRESCDFPDNAFPYHITLSLHAHFFIDAGRRKFELKNPENPGSIKMSWNRRILQFVLLSCVIEELNTTFVRDRWAATEIAALIRCISETKFYQENREHLTRNHAFCQVLTKGGWKWQLLPASQKYLEISGISEDFLWQPIINAVVGTAILVNRNAGKLVKNSSERWDKNQTERLLAGLLQLEEHRRYSDATLKFLSGFAADNPYLEIQFIKKFLKDIPFSSYNRQRTYIRELLDRKRHLFRPVNIASSNWNGHSFLLWKEIALAAQDVLPMALEHVDGIEWKSYSRADLDAMLPIMEARLPNASESEKNLLRSLVCELGEHAAVGIDLREAFGDRKLFYSDQETVPVSLNTMLGCHTFKAGGMQELLKHLSSALADFRYFLLSSYDGVMERVSPSFVAFSERECLRILELKPLLNPNPEARLTLLKKLKEKAEERILRYLLHGDPDKYDSDEELWVISIEKNSGSDTWRKLLNVLLRRAHKSSIAIESILLDALTESEQRAASIVKLTPDEILRKMGNEAHSQDDFEDWRTVHTWKYVLDAIHIDDPSVREAARALPIYPIQQGRFTAYDSDCYFEEDLAIENIFLSTVKRLIPDCDSEYREKQMKLFGRKIWNARSCLQYCKRQMWSDELTPAVLDAIQVLSEENTKLSDDERDYLRSIPFLTDIIGRRVTPADILPFDKLSEATISVNDLGIYFWEQVNTSLFSDSVHDFIKAQILWPEPEALTRLNEALELFDDYSIGVWELSSTDYTTEIFCEIFSGERDMPVARMIQELRKQGVDVSLLLREQRPIPADRLARLCNSLGRKVEIDLQNGMLQAYYLDLLRQAVSDPVFGSQILPKLWLPNKFLQMKKSSELGYKADNVDGEFLLHPELRNLIPPNAPDFISKASSEYPGFESSANLSKEDFVKKVAACWPTLQEYFKDWPEKLYPLIGAFLILSDDSIIIKSEVEKRYLPERAESLRYKISPDFELKQPNIHLHVDIFHGEYCEICSLTGSWIEVPLQQNKINNLLVGDDAYSCRIHYHHETKKNAIYLALRKIDPTQYTPETLTILLKNTVCRVLRKRGIEPIALDECWETLQKADQFDLETTKKLLLEDLLFSLQALGLNQNGNLKPLLSEWKKLRTDKKEAERDNQPTMISRLNDEIAAKQEELEELLRNPVVQDEVLTAIRKRISTHFGYDYNSVALELLQNADDASEELSVMMGDQYPINFPQEFFIQYTLEAINIIHWGRPINKYNGYGFDRGLELGFRNDLEKMLHFLQSDKEDGDMKRTGKFGLGFKSAFLLSNEPLVASGSLQFRIFSGLLPVEVQENEKRQLRCIRESMQPDFPLADGLPQPTVFHLPFRRDLDRWPDKAAFLKIMPLLAYFSQKINRIVVFENSNRCGEVRKENGKEFYCAAGYAIFALNSNTTLVLGHELDAFTPIASDVPTIWVTVPTKEVLGLGFVVNSVFEIDVGRMHLIDSSSRNEDLMSEASDRFYRILRTELLPKPELLPSLWNVFRSGCVKIADSSVAGCRLSKSLIWGNDRTLCGYGKFIFEHPALPSGLPGRFDKLCCAKDVRRVADKTLTEVWNDLSPWLDENPGTIIAESIAHDLKKIHPFSWTNMNVTQLLWDRRGRGNILKPEDLNGIAWANVVPRLKKSEQWPEIRKAFQDFRFLSKTNQHSFCGALLLADNSENYDEQKRAQFAPPDAILSSEYDSNAKELFIAIREQLNAPAERLAEWALKATSNDAQKSALKYLLNGELGSSMAKELLAIGIYDSWLNKLSPSHSMGLDSNDLAIVLGRLCKNPVLIIERSVDVEYEGDIFNEDNLSDRNYLEDLFDWWSKNHQTALKRYNLDAYGREEVNTIRLTDAPEKLSVSERMEWMELLILGAAHTLGRTKIEQHKGFINFLKEREYWHTFCDSEIDTQKWLDVLDDFIDKEHLREEFSYWMRLYIRIYQFSKYLNDYITIFSWWNSDEMPNSREDLCRFRNNQRYAGTIAPPDLFKALGSVGLHFVYRELLRRKVIENRNIHRYCFVPYRNIRDGFGDDSIQIYDTIQRHLGDEKVTFLNTFDVAIRAYQQWGKR